MLLDELNKSGLISLKISLEDEGATLENIRDIVLLCKKNDISLSAKIGGCEAKTDLKICRDFQVNTIVGPMIETIYAFRKFKNMCRSILGHKITNYGIYINIETVTALDNFKDILVEDDGFLTGVVFGRSDIAGSLGCEKEFVNSNIIYELIKRASTLAKNSGLMVNVGGNVSNASKAFLSHLYYLALMDRFETRNVICEPDANVFNTFSCYENSFERFINNAMSFEREILHSRMNSLQAERDEASLRYDHIIARQKTETNKG